MSMSLTHKNPTVVPPIVFDYLGHKSSNVTLPKLCMCNMFKDHNLVAAALSCNPGECREIFMHCVRRGQWTTSEAKRDDRAFTVLYRSQ